MLSAREAKLTYQITCTLLTSMVSFLPSTGAMPTVDGDFSHIGVDPTNTSQMSTSGNVMKISGTQTNNVIGWRDFSVGKGETVQFSGNDKNYLNLVTGASSSAIYGSITGGKDVYLVNPHGVIFANGASVNVGNLYVSTQNVNPADVISAAKTANASGTSVTVTDVLGSDYNNPTKKAAATQTVDGKEYKNAAVSHLADVVSLIDDQGSVQADKVVLVGGHVRFLNSDKVTAKTGTVSVEAYYDRTDGVIEGYAHVGNSAGTNAGWTTNGSVDYYKLITSLSDLQGISSNLSQNYMLSKDIDASSIASWTPIGSTTTPFTGKLDGMMHEIKNLKNTSTSGTNQGLFGETSNARIDNVGISNPAFDVSTGGALIGSAKNTKLRAVYVDGGTMKFSARGGGGLIGTAGEKTTLDIAYSTTTVDGTEKRVGGIVGKLEKNTSLKNVYFAGTLKDPDMLGVYGEKATSISGDAPKLEFVYYATGKDVGQPTLSPMPEYVVGPNKLTKKGATYTNASQDWDISNVGGTNSIWRIYEGRTYPLLTAFMKGTIEADVSVKEYGRVKNSDGTFQGNHASADSTFAAYTSEVTGSKKDLKGKDLNQVYDANVIKYVKNDGAAISTASDVDFLHTLDAKYDADKSAIRLGDDGTNSVGVRNVDDLKSYIYSIQKGYDIVGGNITITKRDVASASNPIELGEKIYDGIVTVTKAALQKALDSSTTTFSGILPDDQAIGLKLVATDHLASYTKEGYNDGRATKYTGTNDADAGYNKIIKMTDAAGKSSIDISGMTLTEAKNYNLNTAAIAVTGTIKQREVYVGLHKTTGIDKTYDATSDVREMTSKSGGLNWTGGTEGVAPDENIYDDQSDPDHQILNNEASIDYAHSTAKYYDGTTTAVNAGAHDVKYDNITLTGAGKANYKLVDINNKTKVIYAAKMNGAPAGAADAVDQKGTLDAKGTINRRALDKETFEIISGTGAVSKATKVYDNTAVYDSGTGAFKMMTNVQVDDVTAAKETNLAANKEGILKSEIDKISFTVATGKGTFKQGDRLTDAVDAAGSARAKFVAYELTAKNEDTTKDWLANYMLVDKTTTPETKTNLYNGAKADILAAGEITKRALYVDLGKKTGIDKVYDGKTAVNTPYNTWNDTNTTAAANGGAVYSGASLTDAKNRLVAGDGTSMKVTAVYDTKDVIRAGESSKTDYETVHDNTHTVNYTIAVDGAKSHNYVLVDHSITPATPPDTSSTALATPASVALSGKGKITPRDLVISFGDVTKEYDTTTNLKTSDHNRQPNLTGLVSGETITVSTIGQTGGYAAAYDTPAVGTGKTVNYTNVALGQTAKNYTLKAVSGETVKYTSETTGGAFSPTTYDVTGKGAITKATIKYITATTDPASKIYDGGKQVEYTNGSAALSDVKNLITSVTVENGDGTRFNAAGDVALSKAAYRDKNVGTGKTIDYTFTVANTAFYNNAQTATYTATNGEIKQREVTVDQIVHSDLRRTYLGTDETGAWDTSASITAPRKLTGDALLTFKGAAHVTGGIAAQGDDTGLIAGDAVTNATAATYDTGNVKRGTGRSVSQQAHTVTYNLKLSGADAGNYKIVDAYTSSTHTAAEISTKTGKGTIEPITVHASVGDITKVYDGKAEAKNVTPAVSSGMLFGDTPTITGTYQANAAITGDRAKDVGTKTVNYVVDGRKTTAGGATYNLNDNYDIQVNGNAVSYDTNGNALLAGKGSITKRDLYVQDSADVKKTYDGTDAVTTGGTITAVANAADATHGLQKDDSGTEDTVTFSGYTKAYTAYGSRGAADANADAGDPDSTAMVYRVDYKNVQAGGADLKNYNLVGKETGNNLRADASGTDRYSITGKGRIDRVALNDADLTMTIGTATKIYDGTTDVKHNETVNANGNDAYAYISNIVVNLGGGKTQNLNNTDFEKVTAVYADKNVRANGAGATGNVTYTIKLGANIGNGNYTIGTGSVTRTGNGTITPREVKATLQNDAFTKVYDGTQDVKVNGAAATGDALITLETKNGTRGWVDGTLTRTAAYDTKHVSRDASGAVQSNKQVTYTNAFDSADTATNYNITYVKKDGTTPVTFSAPATAGGVTTSTHTTGAVNTITPKDLTITAPTVAALTKTWDDTKTVVPASGDGKLVLNGKIGTDAVALNEPTSIGATQAGKYTAAYDSADAGSRKVSYAGVAIEGADAGNYDLVSYAQPGGAAGTLTKNTAGRYDFSVNGAINKRILDASQIKIDLNAIEKVYDGTRDLKHRDAAGTTTTGKEALKKYISSIVLDLGTSTVDLSGKYIVNDASYADPTVKGAAKSTLKYDLTVATSNNFEFRGGTAVTGGTQFGGTVGANVTAVTPPVSGNLSITTKNIEITPRPVEIQIGAVSKVYDGTAAASAPTVTYETAAGDRGWVETGTATITGVYQASGTFRAQDVSVDGTGNVQSDKQVKWTAAHAALSNYSVTYKDSTGATVGTGNTTATTTNNAITQKKLTAGFADADRMYNGTDVVDTAVFKTTPAPGNPAFTGLVSGENYVMTQTALNELSGRYGSRNSESGADVALDAAGNEIYKPITYSGVEKALRKLADNGDFKNSNYTTDATATGKGTIRKYAVKIDDIWADYGTVERSYQKGEADYTTEVKTLDAENALRLWVNAPSAGGGMAATRVDKTMDKTWFDSGDVGTNKTVTYTIRAIRNFKLIDASGNDALAGKTDADKFTYLNKKSDGSYRWSHQHADNKITPRIITVTAVGKHAKTYDGTDALTDYVSGDLTYTSEQTDTRGNKNTAIFALDAKNGTAFTITGAKYSDKDASAGTAYDKDLHYDVSFAKGNGNYSITYKDASGTVHPREDTATAGTPLAVTVRGDKLGRIDPREVKVQLKKTTGLDKRYDGNAAVDPTQLPNEYIVFAKEDGKTGILNSESAHIADNASAVTAHGTYRADGTDVGATDVYRTGTKFDPSHKDVTYDFKADGLTLTVKGGAPSTVKASNYKLVADNTVDYTTVRTPGAKLTDKADGTLRATGTIKPQAIKLAVKTNPTKVYDGNADLTAPFHTIKNIANADDPTRDISSDSLATAATTGISLIGTPQYNSKNVSEAKTATYALQHTNTNYDLYDATGTKLLSAWDPVTRKARTDLTTAAAITPRALTWDTFGAERAVKTYDGTTTVSDAREKVFSLTPSVGKGDAIKGVIGADRAAVYRGLAGTTGVYDNAHAATGESAAGLIDHTVTYKIDTSQMDAVTYANYKFADLKDTTGKGTINRAELVVRPDSQIVPMGTPGSSITFSGAVTGAIQANDVTQGDFSYGFADPSSFLGTGESDVTVMGSNRVRPAYLLSGTYKGKTEGNYGMNYTFRNDYGTLDVKMFAPNREDPEIKKALIGDRRFTPDDFAYYDASLSDWKSKGYYRQADALVSRSHAAVNIDGAIAAEDAVRRMIPQDFGDYTGIGCMPAPAEVQVASSIERNLSMPDDDVLQKERKAKELTVQRRAMVDLLTEGLGVAL